MPDSTVPPGNPAVLRDTDRRSSEQGVGAPRRTSLGEARPPPAGLTHARRPAHGPVARPERVGPRWRDIEWVDFTSDPDSANLSAAAPELSPLTPPEPAWPAAPGVGNVLRHFAKPPARSPAAGDDAIPGLVPRFVRMPVRRSPAAPPATARRAAAKQTGGVVLHPRLPALPAAPPRAVEPPAALVAAKPVAAPPQSAPPAVPRPAAIGGNEGRPFPASIYTPTSVFPAPPEPAPPLRATLATRLNRVGTELRGKSGIAAAALAGGLGRAGPALATGLGKTGAALRARMPRAPAGFRSEPKPRAEAPRKPDAPEQSAAPPSSVVPARLAAAADGFARRAARMEPRLRLTGLVVLSALLVALAAYLGGALIAGLAGAGGDTSHQAASNPPIRAAEAAIAAPPATAPPKTPPSDPAARAALYLARAKAGDAAAQYDAGVLYARGDGLVQDYASAASWFHAAAAQGNVAAQYNLGVLYERGLGVPADETEALNWYRSAADQNHADAQFNLALTYAEGRGTQQDFATAARWYQRSAAQGLVPAMVNLAIVYERGDGVDRSLIEAYAWYSAAGERGDAGAKDRAGELFGQFTDKDKARAQGLAATIGAALDASAHPA